MNLKELFNKFRSKKAENLEIVPVEYKVEVSDIKPIFVKEDDTYPGMYGFKATITTEHTGNILYLIHASDFDFLYDADRDKVYRHTDPAVNEKINQEVKDWISNNKQKFSLTIPPDYFKVNPLGNLLAESNDRIILTKKISQQEAQESSYSAKVKYTISDVRKLAMELGAPIKDCVKVMNSINGDVEKAREIIIKSQEQQKKKVVTKAKLAKMKEQEMAVSDKVTATDAPIKEKTKKPSKKSKKDISINAPSKPLETNPKQPS